MKKLFSLSIMLILFATILSGCSTTDTSVIVESDNSAKVADIETFGNLMIIEKSQHYKPDGLGNNTFNLYQLIGYDCDTKVMYTITLLDGYEGSGVAVTPLYNADGTLRTYK